MKTPLQSCPTCLWKVGWNQMSRRTQPSSQCGAIRRLRPDYDLWRDFPYEYEFGKLAIDVINGSPLLREWVDDAGAERGDLDALTLPDEQEWEQQRKPYLLY